MDPRRGEYLEYRCRCGYVIITPTLDADPDEARRQWERRLGQWVLAGQQDNFPEPPPFMDEVWTRYAEELKQWVWEEKLWNYNGRVGFLPKPPVKPSEKKGSRRRADPDEVTEPGGSVGFAPKPPVRPLYEKG